MAAVDDLDWDALHRALWAAIAGHTSKVGETTAEYSALIRDAVREAQGGLSAEADALLADYLDEADALVRTGIEQAVRTLADPVMPKGLVRDEFVARQVAEAFAERWPDGLHLSERLWAWNEATRRGVSQALAAGIDTGRTLDGLVMDLQRAIEAAAEQRFELETRAVEDWADRLRAAAQRSIRDPGGVELWAKAVGEARASVEGLAVGGTRRQAEATLASILEAVTKGRLDLVDQHLSWWLYDRQLYALKRIVRTEMATAHHKAVLAIGEADPDVTGYHWRLSASHPEPDICDFYADIELGLGKGVWPKDQAPRGKAHPQCMCTITPTTRRQRRDGERGATSIEQFLERAPRAAREQLVPKWVREALADGVPAESLTRPDGLWWTTREDALARGVIPDPGAPGEGSG